MKRISLIATALASTVFAFGCNPNQTGFVESVGEGDLSNGLAPRVPVAKIQRSDCGPGLVTQQGLADLQRLPYLQHMTSTEAWVLWTSTADDGSVVVTTPAGEEIAEVRAEVDESAPLPQGRQYVARLTDLEPATVYCYEVRDGAGTLAERTGFRTAPAADSDEMIRFVSFGDMGEDTGDQLAVLDQLMTVDYDFALLNGDTAYDDGTLAQFETKVFAVYADIMRNIPFFPASGNHEYHTDDARPFREVFAMFENGGPQGIERWYSFDWGHVHVAVIDTEKVGNTQAEWLDADLAATDKPWKIVVGHKPPYSSGSHGSNGSVRDTFGPIFERRGVDLTFWGHDHDYERTISINGVTYIVAGGGGVGTRPVGESDFTAYSEQVAHFVYGEADAHELRVWAIDASGKDFDSLVLRK